MLAIRPFAATVLRACRYSARVATPPEDPSFGTSKGTINRDRQLRQPDRQPDLPSGRPEPERTPRDVIRFALPWVLASLIVLAVAVTAGFVTAYLVASGRAVQPPDFGLVSPTPHKTPTVTLAPGETPQPGEATIQPRRTPTPPPQITPESTPFVHVVARGEYLTYIAGLYCVDVNEIIALNNITNPNRIRVGTELLIPGSARCSSPAP